MNCLVEIGYLYYFVPFLKNMIIKPVELKFLNEVICKNADPTVITQVLIN